MHRQLWALFRPYLGVYLIGLFLLIATNGAVLFVPHLLGEAVDSLRDGVESSTARRFALTMAAVALGGALVRVASRLAILGASRRIARDVRQRFFEHLLSLEMSTYDGFRTGDLMSRAISDVRLMRAFYGPGLLNLLNTTILYTGTLVVLMRMDATLSLFSLSLFPVLFLLANRLGKVVYSRSIAVQEQLAELSNLTQENLSGIQRIKLFAREAHEIERFHRECQEFRRRSLSMVVVRGLMTSTVGILAGLGTLVVLYLGGRHVVEGVLTLGEFVAFLTYLSMLVGPTVALGRILNVFQRGAGAMKRLLDILAIPGGREATLQVDLPLQGVLDVRGLDFAYDSAPDRPVLSGIDLHIPQGTRVAIVGPIGSGKSTLLDILAGIYPPPPQTVFLDGQDIRESDPKQWRTDIGYVPQESFLFSRTFGANIRLGRENADDDAVRDAIELASLDGEVEGFPGGLETEIGERGLTLSGGQRQRATLARSVLPDPRILLLDDALSSVDARTEEIILSRLWPRMEGKTCILVTHRPSVLRAVDLIVVLDHGRIVQCGPFERLVREGGPLRELFHLGEGP